MHNVSQVSVDENMEPANNVYLPNKCHFASRNYESNHRFPGISASQGVTI